MKAIIRSLALAFCLVITFSLTPQAQSANGLVGKAHQEVGSCLATWNGPSWDVRASVGSFNCVTTPCPIRWVVTFAADPKCPPPQICPLRPSILIATVYFDSDGNVVSSQCISN